MREGKLLVYPGVERCRGCHLLKISFARKAKEIFQAYIFDFRSNNLFNFYRAVDNNLLSEGIFGLEAILREISALINQKVGSGRYFTPDCFRVMP